MQLKWSSTLIALSLIRLSVAEFLQHDSDLVPREIDDLYIEDLFARALTDDLVHSWRSRDTVSSEALLRRAGSSGSKKSSSRKSSSSRSPSPAPVEWHGQTCYVWMGGQAWAGPGQTMQPAGLDSCTGVLAVGNGRAFGAHLTPGRETEEARQARSALGAGGYNVYIKLPNNAPSNLISDLDRLLGVNNNINHCLYNVGANPNGEDMKAVLDAQGRATVRC